MIQETILLLKNETFKFTPERYLYIDKSQGGTRFVTVMSFRDKIVMEVIRIVLESVFEPRFNLYSHSYRSGRRYHTALKQVKKEFGMVSWYIKSDIFKYFNFIDHHKLMAVIEPVIKDRKFTRLILKSLRTRDFKFRKYKTFLINLILTNIYMYQFDLFVEKLKRQYSKGNSSRSLNAYKRLSRRFNKKNLLLSKKEKRKVVIKIWLFFLKDSMDPNFRRLLYVRYVNDCITGICGTHLETVYIKMQIKEFLKKQIGLGLNNKNFLIIHAATGKVLFLGIYIFKAKVQKQHPSYINPIVLNSNEICLEASIQQIISNLTKANYIRNGISCPKFIWLYWSLEQIIIQYNSVLRKYTNYYSFVNNRGAIVTYIYYFLLGSCAKLIAAKMKLGSQGKVYAKYSKSLIVNKRLKLSFRKPSYVIKL